MPNINPYSMSDKKEIANILKQVRKKRGYSQDAVATHLDIGRVTYQTYESGRSKIPFELAIDFAKLCNVPLDTLAGNISLDHALQQESISKAGYDDLENQIFEISNIDELRELCLKILEEKNGLTTEINKLKEDLQKLVKGLKP